MQEIKKEGLYRDLLDPQTRVPENRRCQAYLLVCPECGTKFQPGETQCSKCGAERPRCSNSAVKGEIFCSAHLQQRPKSIYAKLADTLTDSELEELIQADDHDVSQEFALARICVASAVEKAKEKGYSEKTILNMLKDFFTIAEKKKNIEQGQELNISWNDEMVNSLRLKIRSVLKAVVSVANEEIKDPEDRARFLKKVKARTKMSSKMAINPPTPESAVQQKEEFNAAIEKYTDFALQGEKVEEPQIEKKDVFRFRNFNVEQYNTKEGEDDS